MARNPYVVLGLSPSASDSEIRAAFRKLAKKFHPDRNPDDKAAEDRFKEISAAFDILGDPERRKKYDRGEIDEEGREKANPFGGWAGRRGGHGAGQGAGYGGAASGGASFDDLSDIFSDLFGARGGAKPSARGRDVRYRLQVEFLESVNGTKKRVTMPDGRVLDLAIPSGLEDGQTLRLRGQGEKGVGGGPAGDVYVEVKVAEHELFERRGNDIYVEAPITLREAVLGGKITAPTVSGDVSISVPPNSSSGTVLRLRGRGVKNGRDEAGDQYVSLKIVLPEEPDPELEEFVRQWEGGARQDADKHFAGV